MKTHVECNKCGEVITVCSDNWVQAMASESYLKLKCHSHYRKHGIKYLKNKGIIKATLKILLAWLLWLVLAPLFYITYPFWWVHEKIAG